MVAFAFARTLPLSSAIPRALARNPLRLARCRGEISGRRSSGRGEEAGLEGRLEPPCAGQRLPSRFEDFPGQGPLAGELEGRCGLNRKLGRRRSVKLFE